MVLDQLRSQARIRAMVEKLGRWVCPGASVLRGETVIAGIPEVLPMSFQALLAGGYRDGDQTLMRKMLARDPELIHLAIGLLFDCAP